MSQLRAGGAYTLVIFLFLCSAVSAQTLAETAGHYLGSSGAQSTLLVIGAVFMGLSIVTMGSGVAEFLCFLSFTLLFVGRYAQGEDLWLPLGLLVVGIAMAALEVFVLPGFGVGGVLAGVSFVALSVIVAESLEMGVAIFLLSTVLSVGATLLALKLVPHLCFTRRLFVLEAPKPKPKELKSEPTLSLSVGDRGRTVSSLRPAGSAVFGGETFEVASKGELLAKDTEVEIVDIEPGKVWVRSIPPSDRAETEGSPSL